MRLVARGHDSDFSQGKGSQAPSPRTLVRVLRSPLSAAFVTPGMGVLPDC